MEKEFIGEIVSRTFSELKSEVINRFFNIKENIFKSLIYGFDKYNIYGTVLNGWIQYDKE